MGIGVSTREVAITAISEAIKIATEFDNVESEGFNTSFSPELLKREKDACLSLAVQDARRKAEAILAAMEENIGAVQAISETYINFNPIRPLNYLRGAALAENADASTLPPIEAKPQDLKVGVSVTFAIQ